MGQHHPNTMDTRVTSPRYNVLCLGRIPGWYVKNKYPQILVPYRYQKKKSKFSDTGCIWNGVRQIYHGHGTNNTGSQMCMGSLGRVLCSSTNSKLSNFGARILDQACCINIQSTNTRGSRCRSYFLKRAPSASTFNYSIWLYVLAEHQICLTQTL